MDMDVEEKRTWSQTVALLENTYTLSIRDVCRILKTSRSWVNRYILPHVDKIYLNSNIRGDRLAGMNWVRTAAVMLDRDDMKESTWLHTDQVYDLLQRSIVSITKQIKSVPLAYLIDERKRDTYIQERDELQTKLREGDPKEYTIVLDRLLSLHTKYLDQTGMALYLTNCSVTQRGKAERVDVAYPGEFDPTRWIAAHDIKDYGDTDESVYRYLFRRGCIRIEIAVPDAKGEVGSKIYYIEDPEYIENLWHDRLLNIPELEWQKYKRMKGL